MRSFYNTLKSLIGKKIKTKEEFQEIIVKYNVKGWLTDEEMESLMEYLDEVYSSENEETPTEEL